MTANNSPIISLKNVGLKVGQPPSELEIFKNISVDIFPGDSVVLVGPSGKGKTSLLRLIGGLETPTSGEVLWSGKSLPTLSHGEKIQFQRRIGMLFQKNALFDSMTVFENVAFPILETTTLTREEVSSRVEKYLRAVNLWEFAEHYPNQISGGMQKRLGIARALALEPNIILYDDPTAGLDPITSRRIALLILELREKFKSTTITVTNDMNRAYQLGGRILFVFEREVVQTANKMAAMKSTDQRIQQFIHGLAEGPLSQ